MGQVTHQHIAYTVCTPETLARQRLHANLPPAIFMLPMALGAIDRDNRHLGHAVHGTDGLKATLSQIGGDLPVFSWISCWGVDARPGSEAAAVHRFGLIHHRIKVSKADWTQPEQMNVPIDKAIVAAGNDASRRLIICTLVSRALIVAVDRSKGPILLESSRSSMSNATIKRRATAGQLNAADIMNSQGQLGQQSWHVCHCAYLQNLPGHWKCMPQQLIAHPVQRRPAVVSMMTTATII